jgi:translation initiation factor 2B subunit (eIF-2B alpha/beta/delta family)
MLSKICEEVTEAIRDFISSKIIGAIEQICKEGTDLIRDNEVILTYKMNTSI